MKTKKIMLAAGGLMTAALPIATTISCGGGDKDYKKTIAVVVSDQTNSFFQNIADAAIAEARKDGYDVDVFDSSNDIAKETGFMDIISSKKYAGVIWNPVNAKGSQPASVKLKSAEIPFTLVDRTLEGTGNGNIASIATDNALSAKNVVLDALTKYKAINASTSTKAIISAHVQGKDGASAAIDRDKGFNDAKTEATFTNGGWSLDLGSRTARADWDTDKAVNKVSAWKTDNLKFIFAENDNMALGAVKVYESDSSFPMIVGFDGLENAKAAVDAGTMYATVVQDTTKMGADSVLILREVIENNNALITNVDKDKKDQSVPIAGNIYKNAKWTGSK